MSLSVFLNQKACSQLINPTGVFSNRLVLVSRSQDISLERPAISHNFAYKIHDGIGWLFWFQISENMALIICFAGWFSGDESKHPTRTRDSYQHHSAC